MTFPESLAWLDAFVNYERYHKPAAMRRVRLLRMRQLMEQLGNPQRHFRSVVVTGTNGKGSICAMIYAMLREGRLRAGLYTSPHVENVRERIRTAAAPPAGRRHGEDWISEADFAGVVAQLKPAVEALRGRWRDGPPTYFELMTAAALLYFQKKRVDIAVLEVGMGGRLDATNVVSQAVSVIGPVDIDHADVLGADAVSIAREKAGIIKPNQRVIAAAQRGDVLAVLRGRAALCGSPMLVYGQDITARIHSHSLSGLKLSITALRGIYESVELPLLGRHQAENAALAVAALEVLSNSGIARGMVERGLAAVAWPGRLEVVQKRPLVLMDGGHNPHAAGALWQTLAELRPASRIHFLIGLSADKPVDELARRLAGLPMSITCTTSRHPRALDPVALSRRMQRCCSDIHVMPDPIDAYTYLVNAAAPEDVVVVTGSFFLVGELRAAIRRSQLPRERRRQPARLAA